MNCKEVKKFIEIYSDEEMKEFGTYDELILHLEKCQECKEYLSDIKKTRNAIIEVKKSQLNQYQSVKKDNREFNNEFWIKVRKAKNKPKSLIFVWGEVAVVILLIGISIWNYEILSKECVVIIGVILMTIGMVYTNYKEVESNEGI